MAHNGESSPYTIDDLIKLNSPHIQSGADHEQKESKRHHENVINKGDWPP
ncbi:hypothetical protein F2Q69_00041013 [Brassica cretica]|uniref:Uncharacterized protein n=1 Tax=Brassica cretica TaxID=69181 RepID=A0A8S9NI71_BRACR|nr:hypothetical protein F2Q69_00041013 [Brassica cretica]